jgi:CMP-N-acetylneuraminic acid synthetase
MFSVNTIPVLLERSRVIDIDTEEDWELAELMFKSGKKGMNVEV